MTFNKEKDLMSAWLHLLGLGLSIAQWIVSRHGGHIEVLSREGLGTRFTVCLRAEGESER